jgi:diguanylate cyclase (GGDEF)-like protein/PAS domain S-box-containing protein
MHSVMPGRRERGHTQPQPERVARLWSRAMTGTSYVSLSGGELLNYLTGLASDVIAALGAEPFNPATGYDVGRSLVATHFTQPASLDRTLCVLGEQLAGYPEGDQPDPAAPVRLARLLAAIGAGYAQALHDRTLAEQEEIRTAAMLARSQAEQARQVSEARFRAVFAGAAIGIGIADVDGQIIEVNQAICDMLGYTAEELRQRRVEEFIHPADAPGMWDEYGRLVRGERDHIRLDKPYVGKDGQAVWTDLVVSLIRDQRGRPQYVVAMLEDITERYQLQTRLRHQALHDPVTELPNRTLFFDRLAAALHDGEGGGPDDQEAGAGAGESAVGSRVGVCYLDIDGFRVINDTLGHDLGDELLLAVARRLDDTASGPGQLVARTGGDEFAVLVERSTGTDGLVRLAEAALDAVREPLHLGGHEIAVSASIGVVERAVRATTPFELMKAADTTLSWAKADGRNRWALFDAERHATEVSRFELSASLPGALERREFYVEYQPLVRLLDDTPIGVEALVRWRHPRLGPLGPDRFVGLTEESGLIAGLGRWVLTEACRQAAVWRRGHPGRDLVMSVNIAVRQLRDPDLVLDVVRILEETGIRPEYLQLEITESAVMTSGGEPLQTLRALTELGVRVAIDDFGTGYSNLAYLRHLPVHVLKLAGSFVDGLRPAERPDPVDQALVATLIEMAHTLGHSVTAEGVETAEQAARLRALGCDTAQGWYYARAGRAGEVTRLLTGEPLPVRDPRAPAPRNPWMHRSD